MLRSVVARTAIKVGQTLRLLVTSCHEVKGGTGLEPFDLSLVEDVGKRNGLDHQVSLYPN
jgi:hypothetical protein